MKSVDVDAIPICLWTCRITKVTIASADETRITIAPFQCLNDDFLSESFINRAETTHCSSMRPYGSVSMI